MGVKMVQTIVYYPVTLLLEIVLFIQFILDVFMSMLVGGLLNIQLLSGKGIMNGKEVI